MPISPMNIAGAGQDVHAGFDPILRRDLQVLNVHLHELLRIGRRTGNEDPLQPFRGLVVSDEEVTILLDDLDQMLARSEHALPFSWHSNVEDIANRANQVQDDRSPLSNLCHKFQLSNVERQCLVAALAPELDLRYERVFAFLQDDVTRKGPGVGLLSSLISHLDPGAARRIFRPSSALLYWRILHLYDRPASESCSLLAKGVRVDQGIIGFLLDGEPGTSPRCRQEFPIPTTHNLRHWENARKVIRDSTAQDGMTFCRFVLSGPAGSGQRELAEWLARDAGVPLHWIDAKTAFSGTERPLLEVREAILRGAALAIEHAETGLSDEAISNGLVTLTDLARPHVPLLFLMCQGAWQPPPQLGAIDWFVVRLSLPGSNERRELWKESLAGLTAANDDMLSSLVARFPLSPEQIRTVAGQVRQAARLEDGYANVEHLQQMCRALLSTRVSGVSESEPQRTWCDLVLSSDVQSQLEELCSQARNRATVLGDWGFAARFSGGKGLHALFSGPPGTGKTLAAEVVAGALRRKLWRIDLAQLVSKYIGETEKNIDRVFRAAGADQVVLFFDEADALFGRRSEVKDAHDRYANQEVSYLLQQMEEYEGVAVLATNLARNLDEAFLRRLQFVVDFPFPDEEHRRRIWGVTLPSTVPLSPEVDFAALARSVRLSGGHIRNIALAAAYLAAEERASIGMRHLWHAARREFQKVGQSWTPPESNLK